MNFFNKFFCAKKDKIVAPSDPNILFGKYTDRNKTKEQHNSWDKAVNLFRNGKYLDAYSEFFNYIRDVNVQNVSFERLENKINFSLIQGSKIVHGTLNEREIQAEAEVAKFQEQNVAVMRKLLKENYYLYFSKFAVRNNIYTLKYFSPIEDAQPSSLYYALKEIATEADMYDDVLVEEFDSLKAINTEHIEEIDQNEKSIKLKYLREWIGSTLKDIEKLDSDKYIGAMAYLFLNLTFKIYYLLSPEGILLDEIRLIQSFFYREDNKSIKEKLFLMREEYEKIMSKPDEYILKSFYKVKATFAVVPPSSHKVVSGFMKAELQKKDSYIENKNFQIAEEVCKYIIYYACFAYGMPKIAHDIMLVFWKVFNPEFFQELGFKQQFYDVDNDEFYDKLIKEQINNLMNQYKKSHPKVIFNVNTLNFTNKLEFAISFVTEFQNLNYD